MKRTFIFDATIVNGNTQEQLAIALFVPTQKVLIFKLWEFLERCNWFAKIFFNFGAEFIDTPIVD